MIPGTAVASIPILFSSSASRSATLEPGWSCSEIVRTVKYWITTPVGCNTVAVEVPGNIVMSHPAPLSGAVRTLANHSLSGVDGDATTVPVCFGRAASFRDSSFCSACVIERGAIFASNFTRARRSDSAFWFASAALAFASDVRASLALSRKSSCLLSSPSLQNSSSVPISTDAAPMISIAYDNLYASEAASTDTSGNNDCFLTLAMLIGVIIVLALSTLGLAIVAQSISRALK
jgi:hypothetical protein